jgi:cyclic di-GMP phosphodiesterase
MVRSDDAYRQSVLVVDDAPENIALVSSLLKAKYRTKVATNGRKALQIAASSDPPDLILLDIMMPEMDGYEVCRRLKEAEHISDIPVIFLTAKTQEEDEQLGLTLGAVDYITKPISPPVVMARVKTHLQLKAARDFLKDKNEYLEREVARRTLEVATIQDVTMVAMGSLAETRDNETGNHIRRTQHYVRLLATKLKDYPRFEKFLTAGVITILFKSAPLHDIGKVGIPDYILLKPDKLTADEFEIMKTHTSLGRDAIAAAENLLDAPASFLRHAREIAYSHHERWDGTGYPEGLSGDDIPISGRLMAVADVYDALITRRVYKLAFSLDMAAEIVESDAGTHFDPDMAEAFVKAREEFEEIARKFADHESAIAGKPQMVPL